MANNSPQKLYLDQCSVHSLAAQGKHKNMANSQSIFIQVLIWLSGLHFRLDGITHPSLSIIANLVIESGRRENRRKRNKGNE